MKKMSFILACSIMTIFFTQTSNAADFASDIAELKKLQANSSGAMAIALKDALDVTTKVKEFISVPNPGGVPFAQRRFLDSKCSAFDGYTIFYYADSAIIEERLGNLAHELTHAVVNEAYNKDFINYANPADMKKILPDAICKNTPPSTVYLMQNEGLRQDNQLNVEATNKLSENALSLIALIPTSGLTKEQQTKIQMQLTSKAATYSYTEYDTCFPQVFIWCYYWNAKKDTKFYKKLEEMANEAATRRKFKARI